MDAEAFGRIDTPPDELWFIEGRLDLPMGHLDHGPVDHGLEKAVELDEVTPSSLGVVRRGLIGDPDAGSHDTAALVRTRDRGWTEHGGRRLVGQLTAHVGELANGPSQSPAGSDTQAATRSGISKSSTCVISSHAATPSAGSMTSGSAHPGARSGLTWSSSSPGWPGAAVKLRRLPS
jgi:hypothetical protein